MLVSTKLALLLPIVSACSTFAAFDGAPPAERVLDPGCVGSVYATIQQALDAAADFDVVEVCPGFYTEHLAIDGKALTLRSTSGAYATIVDGAGSGRGLVVSGGSVVTVDGLTFVGGATTEDGGNLFCADSNLTLVNSVLRGGTAANGGGLASSCAGSATDTTFDGNAAWSGGGAWLQGDDHTVDGCTFTANHADYSGGGLFVDGSGSVTSTRFDGNASDFVGGGAYAAGSVGYWGLNTFQSNATAEDGAGLYVFGGGPVIAGNTFTSNDAGDEAGGLRIKLSAASVQDNLFTSNHADYRGGAMKVSHAAASLSGNTYASNSAWVDGGAVVLVESASTLSRETFTGNSGEDGGGLAVIDGWGAVSVEDCTFSANTATRYGGHVYVELAGQTTALRRVDLDGGTAALGGALYATDSHLVLDNVLVRSNAATTAGGGLFLDATSGAMTNGVAWRNEAPEGSALAVEGGLPFVATNVVFQQNLVGAAVSFVSGASPTFAFSDFSANASDFSGMPSAVGVNGNLAITPRFRRPGTGNFRLRATSALIDAGDPAILDDDGSVSDIGLYGGPESR